MAEPLFEILLFSAYLSAALISVVVAVFAISVSFLGREATRSLWLLKKREKELGLRINEYRNVKAEQLQKESLNKLVIGQVPGCPKFMQNVKG